ncbi:MAG: NADH-quinone oxidoreductase subunit C [Candidatus Rokubacteria bacterium]|nr:NADH-quinone oxidoreductase subunit C [Candidatus Rokubacteria bacterium]
MTTDETQPARATGRGGAQPASPPPPPSFDDTIWPVVDRALAGVTATPERGSLDLIVHVPRDEVVAALRALKRHADLGFDYLRSLTAVDNEDEGIDVVYHLYSTAKRLNLTVKATLPNNDLRIETATGVWRAANWLERETAEMFGVTFAGHPDPRTLLLPEDMTDTFPLRKDHPLAEIEVLQGEGMGYTAEGQ